MNAGDDRSGFFGLDEAWSRPADSRALILPMPYEETTSCGKGTGLAPEAIREASRFVELYDEEIDGEPYRLSGGIATAPSVRFGDGCRGAHAVDEIRRQVLHHISMGKTVVSIGGEHTIAVGAAQAHAASFDQLTVLQLDAHSDLRQEYEGDRYSHASTMARIYETCPHIVQVGIRSQCREEADFIRNRGITTFYAHHLKGLLRSGDERSMQETVIGAIRQNVYLTLDCDFFDPSLIPALGTPEPGGFGWDETLAFLRRLAAERTIVGFDINELAPIPQLFHPQFTIAKLIYKLIGYIFSRR